MRILNEQGQTLAEDQCDLTVGELRQETIIRTDAVPVDDVTKFAWTDGDYETILRYVAVPETERRAVQIDQLKRQLSDTDYAVIKIAEGAATAEEYAAIIAQRQAWRAEINQLEGEN